MITRKQLYERFLQIHLYFCKPGKKRIYLASGYNISVIAGEYFYSHPRDNIGPWTHVEVGFPSDCDSLIAEYMDDDVGGYIPVEVIVELIIKHGGLSE